MDGASEDTSVDVLIGGAGVAGLALAVALREGLGSGFTVVVADPSLDRMGNDPRASAIVAAARRLLATIGGSASPKKRNPSSTWW